MHRGRRFKRVRETNKEKDSMCVKEWDREREIMSERERWKMEDGKKERDTGEEYSRVSSEPFDVETNPVPSLAAQHSSGMQLPDLPPLSTTAF